MNIVGESFSQVLGKILAIVRYTIYSESRRFLPHVIVAFGLVIPILVGGMNFFGLKFQERVFLDITLTAIGWVLVILAISLGISLVAAEIEQRAVYTFVTKPIARWHYMVGKFLGAMVFLVLAAAVFAADVVGVIYFQEGIVLWQAAAAIGLQLIKACIILALVLLLSMVTTPPVNISLTMLVFSIGEMPVIYLANISEPLKSLLIAAKLYILPYLDYLNINQAVVFHAVEKISGLYIAAAAGYGLAYAAMLLALAALIFETKEL